MLIVTPVQDLWLRDEINGMVVVFLSLICFPLLFDELVDSTLPPLIGYVAPMLWQRPQLAFSQHKHAPFSSFCSLNQERRGKLSVGRVLEVK